MSADTFAQAQSCHGHAVCRTRFVVGCFGLIFLVSLAGCRSTGSAAKNPATTRLVETTPSKMNTLSSTESEESSLTEKERVAKVIKPANPVDDQTAPQFVRRSDEIPGRVKSREMDLSRSLIQIMNFEEPGSTQPQRPARRKNGPKRLPQSPDDETSATLRLKFPEELPGSGAQNLEFPESDDDHPELTKRKLAVIDLMFPPPPSPHRLALPTEQPMTLEELEELAMQNNPRVMQALAAITMSQGTTIQAGVSPNPVFGYESDTVGSSFTRDYQGIYIAQPFKTAGKLGLQRAVANMDLMNTQLVYERTKLDVLHDVRSAYYGVLVYQEASKINEALVRFENQVYEIMVKRLKNDEQAGYELSQLQTLVNQARGTLVASQNRYISAWKQLAASCGMPEMRPAPLIGRVDTPSPNLDYDALLEWVLSVHPDLHASRNLQTQAQLNLDLQRRIPIPDVTVAGVFQSDFTTPGYNRTSYNLNIAVPVPIFDRNQGNIRNAEGRYSLSSQQYSVTKIVLTTQLADAFERYQSGRVQAEFYQARILPDLARAYRGVYYRHIDDSDKVAFGDIIVAQQNLAGGVSSYITLLLQQWMAAVDIANLVQLRNFREMFPADVPPPPSSVKETVAPTPLEGGQP